MQKQDWLCALQNVQIVASATTKLAGQLKSHVQTMVRDHARAASKKKKEDDKVGEGSAKGKIPDKHNLKDRLGWVCE